ncbi:MAG: NUDIX hydrolase [Pseudomonadales bacterium]
MPEQPIRPAATVIIARPGASQFEILMLKRTNAAVFAGGMYVFPGGKIDPQDGDKALQPHLSPLSPNQTAQRIALGDHWQACWVAAIRETFEEAGILLAYGSDNKLVDTNAINTSAYRSAIHAGEMSMIDLCRRESLRLALDQLHFFNRWVTPEGRPRRFDTRFFIANAPIHQLHLHDGKETTDSLWISPGEALARNASGSFDMMRVTTKQLDTLNHFKAIEDLMEMAENRQTFEHHRPALPSVDPSAVS